MWAVGCGMLGMFWMFHTLAEVQLPLGLDCQIIL